VGTIGAVFRYSAIEGYVKYYALEMKHDQMKIKLVDGEMTDSI